MPLVPPAELTTPHAATSFDRERLSLLWYGQSVPWIFKRTALMPATEASAPWLTRAPGVPSGHLLGLSADLASDDIDPSRGVVVGGPCIGDCLAFPTLETLYDAVQTALTGKAMGLPVILYLGDREEALERDANLAKWGKLAERIEAWLKVLLSALGCSHVQILRTSLDSHERALQAGGRACKHVAGEEADAAFHLGADAARPQSERSRGVTARVIEAHLPQVVAVQLGREEGAPLPHVIIAENIQQAGVFRLAERLAAPGSRVSFVAHWPAPGLSGAQRMYRARSWEKLPAKELNAVSNGDIPALSAVTRDFFSSWLDADTRAALTEAASGRH